MTPEQGKALEQIAGRRVEAIPSTPEPVPATDLGADYAKLWSSYFDDFTRGGMSRADAALAATDRLKSAYGTPVTPDKPTMLQALSGALLPKVSGPGAAQLGPVERAALGEESYTPRATSEIVANEPAAFASAAEQGQGLIKSAINEPVTRWTPVTLGEGVLEETLAPVIGAGSAALGERRGSPTLFPGAESYDVESGPGHLMRIAGLAAAPVQEAVTTGLEHAGPAELLGPTGQVLAKGLQLGAKGAEALAPLDPSTTAGHIQQRLAEGALTEPALDPAVVAANRPGGVTRESQATGALSKPLGDYLVRTLQDVEDGRGMMNTLGDVAASKGHAPDSWAAYAAKASGLSLDLLIPWDKPLVEGGVALKDAKTALGTAGAIAPAGHEPEVAGAAVRAALAGKHVEVGATVRDVVAAQLAAGHFNPGELPPATRAMAERIARDQYGMSLDDFLAQHLEGPHEPGIGEQAADIGGEPATGADVEQDPKTDLGYYGGPNALRDPQTQALKFHEARTPEQIAADAAKWAELDRAARDNAREVRTTVRDQGETPVTGPNESLPAVEAEYEPSSVGQTTPPGAPETVPLDDERSAAQVAGVNKANRLGPWAREAETSPTIAVSRDTPTSPTITPADERPPEMPQSPRVMPTTEQEMRAYQQAERRPPTRGPTDPRTVAARRERTAQGFFGEARKVRGEVEPPARPITADQYTGAHYDGAMAKDAGLRALEPREPDVMGRKYKLKNAIPAGDRQIAGHPADVAEPRPLTLREAMARMSARNDIHDSIVVAGSDRPVMTWSHDDANLGRPRASYAGASPAEKLEIAKYTKEVPFRIGRQSALNQLRTTLHMGLPVSEDVSRFFRTLLFGEAVPEAKNLRLTDGERKIADLYGEAARGVARNRLGGSHLVPLAGDVWVTPHEAEQINGRVQQAIRDAGINPRAWTYAKDGRITVAPAEKAALESLAERAGVPEHGIATEPSRILTGPADQITLAEYNHVVQMLRRNEAGVTARGRYVAHSMTGFAKWLDDALGSPKAAGLTRAKGDAFELRSFLRTDEASVPEYARLKFATYRRRLSSLSETVASEIRRARGAPGAVPHEQVLADVLARHWTPITPVAYALAHGDVTLDEVADGLRRADSGHVRLTPEETMALATYRRAVDENGQGLLGFVRHTVDDAAAREAAQSWRLRARATVQRDAERMLEAAIPSFAAKDAIGRRAAVADLARQSGQSVPQWYASLYDRVFLRSDAAGIPEMAGRLGTVAPDDERALNFLMRMRSAQEFDRVLRDMVVDGLALRPGSNIEEAASRIMMGTGSPVDAAGRVAHETDVVANDAAVEFLLRSGIEPHPIGMPLARMGGDTEQVALSPTVRRELLRMKQYGLTTTSDVYKSGIANRLNRLWNTGATVGWLIMNPGNFLGNFIGAFPQIYNRLGEEGIVGLFRSWGKNRPITAKLLARTTALDSYTYDMTHGGLLLHTKAGEVYSLDELEGAINKFGVSSTIARAETAEALLTDLRRADRDFWHRLVTGGVIADWQQTLSELSHAQESAFRIGTFVDQVAEGGVSLEEAARRTREALYDVNDLSDFERTWMRKLFTFYAWTRRNTDAVLMTLVTHPDRVLRQMRLHALQPSAWGLTANQQAAMDPSTFTRVVLSTRDMGGLADPRVHRPDGRLDVERATTISMTSPTPTADAIVLLYDLLNMATLGHVPGRTMEDSTGHVLQSAHPLVRALYAMWSGKDLATGRDMTAPRANEFPAWMAELPYVGAAARELFGVREQAVNPGDNPDYAVALDHAGHPVYYAVGAATEQWAPETATLQRAGWLALRQFGGRPVLDPQSSTALRFARVLGFQPLRPWESRSDAALAAALGTYTTPVPSDYAATAALKARQERKLKDETKAANTGLPRDDKGRVLR